MENPTLITTADGSHSLLSPQYQVAYHSHHGAIQETDHVFIEAGLLFQYKAGQPIKILELGFGTGLNAFMTFLKAEELKLPIQYTSLEQFPISDEIANQFNYLQQLNAQPFKGVFQKMHSSSFEKWMLLSDYFRFCKIKKDISSFTSSDLFTLIYYDAFAPETQPELWTESILKQMFDMMAKGGVLVTYCAKGSVKRALRAVGFEVASIPGPPGKREMTRATK